VLPGAVHTPIWERVVAPAAGGDAAGPAHNEPAPPRRIATPDEVAQTILYLASDDSVGVTGTDVVIDGSVTT
jgi:3(or 17)beta-hydroxysteroid dehydrogenase